MIDRRAQVLGRAPSYCPRSCECVACVGWVVGGYTSALWSGNSLSTQASSTSILGIGELKLMPVPREWAVGLVVIGPWVARGECWEMII